MRNTYLKIRKFLYLITRISQAKLQDLKVLVMMRKIPYNRHPRDSRSNDHKEPILQSEEYLIRRPAVMMISK